MEDNIVKISVQLDTKQVPKGQREVATAVRNTYKEVNQAAKEANERARKYSEQYAAFWMKALDAQEESARRHADNLRKLYAQQNSDAKRSAESQTKTAQKSASDRARYETDYVKTWQQLLNKRDADAERVSRKQKQREDKLLKDVADSQKRLDRLSRESAEIRARAAQQLANVELKEAKRSADGVIKTLQNIRRERSRSSGGSGGRSSGNSSGSSDGDGDGAGGLGGAASLFALGRRAGVIGLGIAGVTTLTGFVSQGARAWLDYSATLEQTTIGFETLMGSASQAQSHIRELQEFAIRTPFEFADLATASQKLQGVGTAARDVLPLLNAIGNAVSAVGGGAHELDRVVYAFADIQARGKVTGEEIRQLANNRIAVVQALSQELGVTNGQVYELAEQGKITASVFIEVFKRFSAARFGDAMERQSHTFKGAMSNIKDALLVTSNEAFKPLFQRISTLADEMAQRMKGQNFEGAVEVMLESMFKGAGESIRKIAGTLADEFRYAFTGKLGKGMKEGDKGLNPVQWGAAIGEGMFPDSPGLLPWLFQNDTSEKVRNRRLFREAEAKRQEQLRQAAEAQKKTGQQATDASGKILLDNSEEIREKTTKVVQNLSRQLQFLGDKSEEAATKQKLLAEGITNLNDPLAQQAIALARVIDARERQMELQEEEQRRIRDRDKSIRDELSQWMENTTQQAFELTSDIRTGMLEVEKFTTGVGNKAKTFLQYTEAELNVYIEAAKNLDKLKLNRDVQEELASLEEELLQLKNTTADGLAPLGQLNLFLLRNGGAAKFTAEQVEALRKAYQEVFNEVQRQKGRELFESLGKEITDSVRELKRTLKDLDFGGRPKSPLDSVIESLEDIKELNLEPGSLRGLQDFVDVYDTLRKQLADGNDKAFILGYSEIIDRIQKMIDPTGGLFNKGVNSGALATQIFEALKVGAEATRKLTPLQEERNKLDEEFYELQREVGIAAATAAERYRNAWQEAINDVQMRDIEALESQIRSQVQIADSQVFHSEQARARIMEHMASAKSYTDIVADAFIGASDKIGEGISGFASLFRKVRIKRKIC